MRETRERPGTHAAMTPHQILEAARAGDTERLGGERDAVADAARHFGEIGDAASAIELVGRTWRIWFHRGELETGSAVVAMALATPRASAVPIWEARALYADGLFAFRAGDQSRSRASNEKALEIARQAGDVRGECDALTGMARVALRDGRYGDVVALARQARDRAALAGDHEAGASPLHLEAAGTRLQRDYPAARELYLESLHLNTERGDADWVWMELHNLGWVELHLGKVEEARRRFHERDAATGMDPYGKAWTELNWSAIAAAEGDFAEARRRFDIGTHALEELGMALDPDDQSELEWLRGRLPDADANDT
jgi:tetratricopeptide (TPR) repeat protein